MASKGHYQYSIQQRLVHPITGEHLFSEQNILNGIAHKTIEKWSYILHDKDIKSEEMEADDDHPDIPVGQLIDSHFHIALKCKNAVEIHTIAKWFGVPENFVRILHGANAYIEAVEYETHEHPTQQLLKKHRYDDSEVKSNHDWRKELDLYQARRQKKNASKLNTKDYYRNEVLYHGMTLRQVIEENADTYRDDMSMLQKYRLEYMLRFAELPSSRINYYIDGRGGVGKGLLCEAIARNLFPDLKYDDDIFFMVGGSNVALDGYDGQPVIIWDDVRSYNLLKMLGGRGNVFNIFDTHPKNRRDHIKFGYTRLINCINIVNSVEPFRDFLDGLAGEYKDRDNRLHEAEDKGQSYRRFPIIIPLHEEDFDILLNKGVLNGTREYQQYVEHRHIRGNMEQIHRRLNLYRNQIPVMESRVVSPIMQAHAQMVIGMQGTNEPLEDVLADFASFGTQDVEACKADEREKFNRFIEEQTKIAEYDIRYLYTDAERFKRATTAQEMIKKNPESFFQREDLHLKPSAFMGAYRG